MSDNNVQKRTWLGLIVLLIGAVLLLDNLGIYFFEFSLPSYLFSWKTLLILIGAALLASKRQAGVILIGVGGFFLLPDIFYVPSYYLRDWWPILIIAIGVGILLRSATARKEAEKNEKENIDRLDDFSLLGGSEKNITSTNFKGGNITAILGGSQINLSAAKLAPGVQTLDILAFMGGCSITVPPDWNVKIDVVNILGGFSDDRSKKYTEEVDEDKILVVKGLAIFGGGEIKS